MKEPVRFSVLILALLLGGCSSALLQRSPEPAQHTYMLEWEGDPVGGAINESGPSLLVSSILAAAGFDSSDMAFVRKPHEIEYFSRHHWIDSPARMLDPLLVRAAAQSGLFRNVAEAGSGVRSDLRLESRLLYLQQVCQPQPGRLQLALRVTLIDAASGRAVASRNLEVEEPLMERTPYGGVQAANRAVARLLAALQGFLAEEVGKPGRPD